MIPKIREAFNANFKEEFYQDLLDHVVKELKEPTAFRISETPVFISKEIKAAVFSACDAIIEQLWQIDFADIRDTFVPKEMQSPLPMGKPDFLAIDFGLCDDGKGGITPQLIELQAFPTLFFYQPFLGEAFIKAYPNMPKEGFHYYFSGLNKQGYHAAVSKVILNGYNPENVILLEVFPEKQKTRIDFWATQKALGIEVVCMTKVIKEGKKLFYEKDGRKIPIHRIYNRVIFDELERIENLQTSFTLSDDLEVEWCTHPDWFFVISKCIMPLLKHKNVPASYYLNNFPSDLNLSNYVLKPLFSFAGQGINLHPTKEILDGIEDKQNYILQQKVAYKPLVKTNTAKNSKVELRMLYIWSEEENRLKPVINLTRMSKGEMINVSHQVDETWIGSSISFFEE
ncbi:glutathionylspermidine synthase family protein [Aggregatimonas sangjinii]|uniref:Glutathionylspermidine synthase family protein n=1 Tax=Aggregatimonas sangjinii TaxID=2583587 RepID=A0A5B7ST90_9FLAO|nr:glutathionylspermidine synthase family protein [Aggregatimonas sangjinii]QCX01995.1 glutathionylspermidine synthase family protein [Aggregatimonas sangjinii]